MSAAHVAPAIEAAALFKAAAAAANGHERRVRNSLALAAAALAGGNMADAAADLYAAAWELRHSRQPHQ